MMIVVTAKIKAKQGSEKDLEAAFRKMIADVASEDGTLMYTLHRSQKDPCLFMFYEKYKDIEALKLHSATPHFNALFQTIQPLLAAPPEIEKFDELAKLSK
jgi:quinol monooxygenase YgiN